MRKLAAIFAIFLLGILSSKAQTPKFGDTLPNFSYQGQFAKPYYLKDLKGSYVLVNFWASWNEESRKMQMNYIETFARYKDRKFKAGRKFYIISVSLDESKNTWDLSLKKDKLPWKNQACDFLGWNSPIVQKCGVKNIPCNFLLDPEGRIIALNLNNDKLEEILNNL